MPANKNALVRYRYLDSLPTGSVDGYCLTGWYYEPECINVVTIETDRFHYDTTVYAKWEKLKATATDLPTEPTPGAPVVTPDKHGGPGNRAPAFCA